MTARCRGHAYLMQEYEAATEAYEDAQELLRRAQLAKRRKVVGVGQSTVDARRWEVEEAREHRDGVRADIDEHWRVNGHDPRELEFSLQTMDFVAAIKALYVGSAVVPGTAEYRRVVEREKKLTTTLRDFWVAGGHDLAELEDILARADDVVDDMLPK